MAMHKKIKRRKLLINKLKHKYRLVFFNDKTFEEVWHLRLSLLNVLSAVGTISLLLILLVSALIAFTPLKVLIPGYPDEKMRRGIVFNALRLDSLEKQLRSREKYDEALNAVISGKDLSNAEHKNDSAKVYKNINFKKSEEDSLFRQKVEEAEQLNISVSSSKKESSISEIHFFAPVKGIITNGYNARNNHFGIDIVGASDDVIKATLDGTVIMATWTLETGYVIQIQHHSNIVSLYKHNASLLRKVGQQVKAGDAIAIMGNSGELSTGPHLHFELWYNGKPVNPADYIVFN
ncbi:MAG: M23 family metallopeptidase [Bacteroidota bacterium]|nr:M23 family metallopeptidase [Bacteroidota bacterium]